MFRKAPVFFNLSLSFCQMRNVHFFDIDSHGNMVYTEPIEIWKENIMQKKTAIQLALLGLSVAMIGFGVWRGEADTVFAKAIRLCMECVGIG